MNLFALVHVDTSPTVCDEGIQMTSTTRQQPQMKLLSTSGISCSGQIKVHVLKPYNYAYIRSSTSEGTSNATRTSAGGACTPRRTIA